MNTADVKPRSRWRCVRGDWFEPGKENIATIISLNADGVHCVANINRRRNAAIGLDRFERGEFVPADPAPEASAARKLETLDRVVATGVVRGFSESYWPIVHFDSAPELAWLMDPRQLRPESAPATPPPAFDSEKQCVVDRPAMTALSRFVGKGGFTDACVEALARLKGMTEADAANAKRFESMALADGMAENDRLNMRIADLSTELGQQDRTIKRLETRIRELTDIKNRITGRI